MMDRIEIKTSAFYCIADGITESSPEIQCAINYLQRQDGGTLLFDQGLYLIENDIMIPKTKHGIILQGMGSRILRKGNFGSCCGTKNDYYGIFRWIPETLVTVNNFIFEKLKDNV